MIFRGGCIGVHSTTHTQKHRHTNTFTTHVLHSCMAQSVNQYSGYIAQKYLTPYYCFITYKITPLRIAKSEQSRLCARSARCQYNTGDCVQVNITKNKQQQKQFKYHHTSGFRRIFVYHSCGMLGVVGRRQIIPLL